MITIQRQQRKQQIQMDEKKTMKNQGKRVTGEQTEREFCSMRKVQERSAKGERWKRVKKKSLTRRKHCCCFPEVMTCEQERKTLHSGNINKKVGREKEKKQEETAHCETSFCSCEIFEKERFQSETHQSDKMMHSHATTTTAHSSHSSSRTGQD